MYIEYTHCTKKPHLAYLASTCNHRDAPHLHTLHNSSTRWRGVRYDENTQNIITSTETIWAEPPRLHLSHDPRPHHHFASYVFYFPVPPCILAGEIVLFLPGFFFIPRIPPMVLNRIDDYARLIHVHFLDILMLHALV